MLEYLRNNGEKSGSSFEAVEYTYLAWRWVNIAHEPSLRDIRPTITIRIGQH